MKWNPDLDVFFRDFVDFVGWHKNKVHICEICFPRKKLRNSPTMWTRGHHRSIYFNILTRCMSEWWLSLLSWNLKVVSLHYCVTSQLRLCAPISTTKNTYLCYCVLCICDIYVFCICEYFNKHSFVTSDPLLMLLSVQQFQAEKWWFDEKPQGHALGNTNTNSYTITIIFIRRSARSSLHTRPTVLAKMWRLVGCSKNVS